MATGPHTAADGRKYVVVTKGDTLSEISEKYFGGASKYKQLAAINDISNPDYIVIGQKIYLSEASNAASPKPQMSKVEITHLGWQANSDDTILVMWKWDKSGVTGKYALDWEYQTGDGQWFDADGHNDNPTGDVKYAFFTPPSNATIIRVKVTPYGVDYSTEYFTSYQSVSVWKAFNLSHKAPDAPNSLNVSIDGSTLLAKVENVNELAKKIEFQIVKNDSTVYKTGTVNVSTSAASYSCTIALGHNYKVRCRAINDYGTSEWTNYTANYMTMPFTPSEITKCVAKTSTSVYLEWTAVDNAETYEIRYATSADIIDNSNMTSSVSTTDNTNKFTLGNLTTGSEYFFQIRAKNSKGESGWSPIKSTPIGTKPAAPTTWSSTNVVVCGESVTMYWVHNSEDGSSQQAAKLLYTVNGETHTVNFTTDTNYTLNTMEFSEGAVIQWCVQTEGVTKEMSELSTARSISVVAPATLELLVSDYSGAELEKLISFPISIVAIAGPSTQTPIGYHVSVISNETYETVDVLGAQKTINKNEQVYYGYFDGPLDLALDLDAGKIDLEDGISYTIKCTAAMDSGLTAEASVNFTVDWAQTLYKPNADVMIDDTVYAAHIRPYCSETTYTRHKVYKTSTQYVVSSDVIGSVFGNALPRIKTTTGEQVYYGTTGTGEIVYYCEVTSTAVVEDVRLDVYRREFDGSFTEIMRGIKNGEGTYVTDPHPSLDYARYRIVATHIPTGAVSYYDVPGIPVLSKHMIIQWDEAWSNFDVDGDTRPSQPPWSGSMLKLKANIDVSDQYNPDSSLVNYIGRKRPVSYYGTQLGESSNWSTVIPKDDKETLYALRRLAIWMGDVYVREPSGSGYWAKIQVSFNQAHKEVTIPVSFSITRVEGGI